MRSDLSRRLAQAADDLFIATVRASDALGAFGKMWSAALGHELARLEHVRAREQERARERAERLTAIARGE